MDILTQNRGRYRWFYTSSGKLVVGGKNAMQNEEIVHQAVSSGKEMLVMHTSEPGSPFCVVLSDMGKISKQDRMECAVFTGCFSRAWRARKRKAEIDVFSTTQLYKEKSMKAGTWGVKSKIERISVSLELALTRQKGLLRAVPPSVVSKGEVLVMLSPGTIDKTDMVPKLELEIDEPFRQEELLAALPAGGSKVVQG